MKKTLAALCAVLLLVCVFSTVALAGSNFSMGWNDNNRTYVGKSKPTECAIGNDKFIESEWVNEGTKVITVEGVEWNATQWTGRCDACRATVWVPGHWVHTGPGLLDGYWQEGYLKYETCPRNEHIFTAYVLIAPTDPCAKGHELTKVDEKDATCVATGNMEYWKCDNCEKLFSDSEGKTTTTLTAVTTSKNPDNHPTDKVTVKDKCTDGKSADCEGHQKYCSACNNWVGEVEEHDCEKCIDSKNATCTTEGYVTNQCTVCGHTTTTTFTKLYTLTKHDAVEPTCTKGGNIEYYTCPNDCCTGKYFDKDHNEIEDISTAALGHDMKWVEGVDANCVDTGIRAHYHCKRCELDALYQTGDGKLDTVVTPIDTNNHKGEFEWKDGCDDHATATCTQHEEYCKACEQLTGKKADHIFGEWKITKHATENNAGSKERTCTVCGHVETCAIPKLEPAVKPTGKPSTKPTVNPSDEPSTEPTVKPTDEPTAEPTVKPTEEPTAEPSDEPTTEPTTEPTAEPTTEPTTAPTDDASKKEDGKTDIPKTGDSRNLGYAYLMMALAAAGLCVLAATRKEGKN